MALIGKENFDRIISRVRGVLKMLKPAGNVGHTRHTIGLALFVGVLLFGWVASYAPSWMPEDVAGRVWVNLGLDLLLLVSLFVLGGDFWDKVRALFVCEARAVFPSAADGLGSTGVTDVRAGR